MMETEIILSNESPHRRLRQKVKPPSTYQVEVSRVLLRLDHIGTRWRGHCPTVTQKK
jgi:hypothetical protein